MPVLLDLSFVISHAKTPTSAIASRRMADEFVVGPGSPRRGLRPARPEIATRRTGRVPCDDPAHPGDACPSPDGPRLPPRAAPSAGGRSPRLGFAGAPAGRTTRVDRHRPAGLRRI